MAAQGVSPAQVTAWSRDGACLALDPRVRRSRQMLHDALARLLEEKEFDRISIGEIAEASTLNRATFYDHYPDKVALLRCMVGSRFQELMARRGVKLGTCSGALRAVALGVCDYLVDMPGAHRSGGRARMEESMQTAIVAIVQDIILEGLSHRELKPGMPAPLVASTAAWAIYGAAHAWVQREGDDRWPAEQTAEVIDRLVSPILGSAGV